MPASLRAHVSRATSSSRPYDRRSPTASPLAYSPSPPPTSPMKEPGVPSDHPGLPTYAEYKRIETEYLQSLSPRKRDKALIMQAMFDKIWDVLHQPEACTVETPQFRFWVRKMFTLSRPASGKWAVDGGTDSDDDGTSSLALERAMGIGIEASRDPPSAVVLHEHRPVAIMEQLYEVFCYCHARAGHGGRDKTCGVIREHYSWVPKELTAQFVKACPTCALKRGGGGGIGIEIGVDMGVGHGRSGHRRRRKAREMVQVKGEEKPRASLVVEWPTTGGPLDPENPAPCGVRERLRAREATRTVDSPSSPGSSTSGSSGKTRSEMHEVPLETRNCVFDGGHETHTIFSQAVLAVGNDGTTIVSPNRVKNQGPTTPSKLPSLVTALSNDSLNDTLAPFVDGGVHTGTDSSQQDAKGECLPPALRPLQLLGPLPSPDATSITGDAARSPCLLQIDPVLLSFTYPGTELSGGLLCDPAITYSQPGYASGIQVPLALSAEGQGHMVCIRPDATVRVGGMSIGDVPRSPGLHELRSPMAIRMASPDLPGDAYQDNNDILSIERMRSRCHGSRYGASLAMFLPCVTDEVEQQLESTLSLSILTGA